jgi:hypothetical protein
MKAAIAIKFLRLSYYKKKMAHRHKKIKAVDPQSKRTHPTLLEAATKSRNFNRAPSYKDLLASAKSMPRGLREMLAMKDHIEKRISNQSVKDIEERALESAEKEAGLVAKPQKSSQNNPFAHMVALPGEKLRAFNARLRAETRRLKVQLRADEQPIRKISAKRKRFLNRKLGKGLDENEEDEDGDKEPSQSDMNQRKKHRTMEFAASEHVGFLERADAPPVLSSKPAIAPLKTTMSSGSGTSKVKGMSGHKTGSSSSIKGAWSPEAVQAAKDAQSLQMEISAASRARFKASEDRRADEQREEQLAQAQREKAALASMMAYKTMKAKRQDAFEAAARASLKSTSAQIAALKIQR